MFRAPVRSHVVACTCLVMLLGCFALTNYANAALPAGIPFKESAATDDNLMFRAILAFIFAGAAAFGLAWCIKRFLPGWTPNAKTGKQLERLETMRISARAVIVRVRWGKDELLIGESEHGVTLIDKRPFESANDDKSEIKSIASADANAGREIHE